VPKLQVMDFDRALLELLNGNEVQAPPYPATALKLTQVLGDPAHHRGHVLDVVRADGPLAAAVLRIANSAMWVGLEPVTTLNAAVARIGEAELGRLALAAGLAGSMTKAGPLARLRRRVWHDSVSAAVCASVIAPTLGLDREELFVAGLLHDIGRMVALHAIEQLLWRLPSEPARTAADWWRLTERYHVELGLLLAKRWQLPELFVDCISQHHQVSPAGRYARQTIAIAAVDQLVDVLNGGVPLTTAVLAAVLAVPESTDHARLAADLAKAPSLIASFEDPTVPERTSKVEPNPLPYLGVAPSVPITFHLPNGSTAECLSARATEVTFTSRTPIPEGYLQPVDASLHGQRISLWLRISASTPSEGGCDVVGHPFALTGQALTSWLSAMRDGAGLDAKGQA